MNVNLVGKRHLHSTVFSFLLVFCLPEKIQSSKFLGTYCTSTFSEISKNSTVDYINRNFLKSAMYIFRSLLGVYCTCKCIIYKYHDCAGSMLFYFKKVSSYRFLAVVFFERVSLGFWPCISVLRASPGGTKHMHVWGSKSPGGTWLGTWRGCVAELSTPCTLSH